MDTLLTLLTSFPAPGIFTNAFLRLPDITALLRDPDAHESALFSVVNPSELTSTNVTNDSRSGASNTTDQNAATPSAQAAIPPRRHTAVTAVLGTDMAERIRRQGTGETPWIRRRTMVHKDEVDINLLLSGAEKLCKA